MSRSATSTASPNLSRQLRGRMVSLSGRLASMSRDDFVEIIESHGASFSEALDPKTAFVVVGQRDLPLEPAGTLAQPLRQARVLARRGGKPPSIFTEEQFLEALGLEEHRRGIHQFQSTATLTDALGLSRERIIAWVKAGLIKPAYTEHGVWFFEFRQVSTAKSLCDLARKGVTVSRLRKSLEQLKTWLPEVEQPLESLSLLHDDGRLLVRLADGDLAGIDGQLHFDYSAEPQPPASLRLAPRPHSAGEWYEIGLRQQAQGYHAEAIASYRQALRQGGPEARLCFCLATALAEEGHKPQAIERYFQAIELEPQFTDAMLNVGTLLAETGDTEGACQAFRDVLAIDPEDLRAHYNLADTLDDMGRVAEAAVHWRAYLRFDKTSQWAAHARERLAAS